MENEQLQNIKNLLQKVSSISKKYDEIAKITGENFNIFKIMNVQSDEVKLHSAFIAELLNPQGTHGQGDIFLKLFVEQLGIKNFDTKNATTEVEKYIGEKTETEGGRIDIVINSGSRNIFIENKIYAGDQPQQLLRYHNADKTADLFYLTLYGTEASEESTGNTEKKYYTSISYSKDIIDWLKKCKKETADFPVLRETITQYINIIKYLTGQTMNDKMKNEIVDIILRTPENINGALEIAGNITDAKVQIQLKFWEKLKELYEKTDYKFIYDGKEFTEGKINSYYKDSRNRKIYYGLWSKIYEYQDIEIYFGIEIEDIIYFGFTINENGEGGIAKYEKFFEYRKILRRINSDYKASNAWLGWRATEPELNFRDFNSDAVTKLADEYFLMQTADKIVKDSVNDIKKFEELITKFIK